MHTKSKIILASLLLIGGAIGGQSYYQKLQNDKKPNYKTVIVERGEIENVVTATGKLQPREFVDVGAQVTGRLDVLHVEIGDRVKKGDLLAEIDVTLFMAKVDQQRAQLKYQEASLIEREAQNTLAKLNFERQANLYDHNATSLELLQSAEATLKSSDAQIAMLKAQIEQIKSSLRADEANLEFTRIYAPMDGTVVSLSAKQGQTLNANQQAPIILQIADLSTMTVKAEVSEADVTKLRIGMDLYFKTIGSQKKWYASLAKVEPTPSVLNNVVLYNALFDVDNNSSRLMTSMTTQVFFILSNASDALLLPPNAITKETPRSTTGVVEVLKEDGKVERREVTLGVSNRISVEILSGVSEGERVIIKPAQKKQNVQRPKMARMF